MSKALDLTNKRFGYLIALKKAPSRNGKTYWLCKCEKCGEEKEIQTGHLTSGASVSCGCSNTNPNISNTLLEKECPICHNKFETLIRNRIYCYACSPEQSSGSADYQRTKKRAIKHMLIQYKGGKCELCGYNRCEGALQFHHKDPNEKEFTLSQINVGSNFSIEDLYKEVDKCQLLCANCHAEIHFKK